MLPNFSHLTIGGERTPVTIGAKVRREVLDDTELGATPDERAFAYFAANQNDRDTWDPINLEPLGAAYEADEHWNANLWYLDIDGRRKTVTVPPSWAAAGPDAIIRLSPMDSGPPLAQYAFKATLLASFAHQRRTQPDGVEYNGSQVRYPQAYKNPTGTGRDFIIPILADDGSNVTDVTEMTILLNRFLAECAHLYVAPNSAMRIYNRAADPLIGRQGNPFEHLGTSPVTDDVRAATRAIMTVWEGHSDAGPATSRLDAIRERYLTYEDYKGALTALLLPETNTFLPLLQRSFFYTDEESRVLQRRVVHLLRVFEDNRELTLKLRSLDFSPVLRSYIEYRMGRPGSLSDERYVDRRQVFEDARSVLHVCEWDLPVRNKDWLKPAIGQRTAAHEEGSDYGVPPTLAPEDRRKAMRIQSVAFGVEGILETLADDPQSWFAFEHGPFDPRAAAPARPKDNVAFLLGVLRRMRAEYAATNDDWVEGDDLSKWRMMRVDVFFEKVILAVDAIDNLDEDDRTLEVLNALAQTIEALVRVAYPSRWTGPEAPREVMEKYFWQCIAPMAPPGNASQSERKTMERVMVGYLWPRWQSDDTRRLDELEELDTLLQEELQDAPEPPEPLTDQEMADQLLQNMDGPVDLSEDEERYITREFGWNAYRMANEAEREEMRAAMRASGDRRVQQRTNALYRI